MNERFIELYNSDSRDVDLTGWYIQRKTATGSSFNSLVTSTQFGGKIIKPHGYFLISRSQLSNSDVVVDLTLTESNTIRIRDSKQKDVDQVTWGSISEGKSYQMSPRGEWVDGVPTPGFINDATSAFQTQSVAPITNGTVVLPETHIQAPEVKKVVAEAGPQTRVVLAGSPIIFEGKISGLENTSGGITHTAWSFGDGAFADGERVSHTYFYEGEYTAVLDVTSGNLKATDKMLVKVVLPNLFISTGGDDKKSFFKIENRGSEEIDMSLWQVVVSGKTFIFPKNTLLGSKRSATFASEVTGLVTPVGIIPELLFPNGTVVPVSTGITTVLEKPPKTLQITPKNPSQRPQITPQATKQVASVVSPILDEPTMPLQKEGNLWPWYIGASFLAVLALFAIRLTRKTPNLENKPTEADEYEIIEEADSDRDDPR